MTDGTSTRIEPCMTFVKGVGRDVDGHLGSAHLYGTGIRAELKPDACYLCHTSYPRRQATKSGAF